MRAMSAPTSTVSPSLTTCSPIVPATGDGTSTATLSVSRLAMGSSAFTASPGFFSHWPRVASVMDSPSVGTTTSVAILFLFRSEEHTSELQSLMRISYAVFCLKKKTSKSTHELCTSTNEHSTYATQLRIQSYTYTSITT